MQITTENLKVGMLVTVKNKKGLLTVTSISDPLESCPIQFRVGFVRVGCEEIRGLFTVDEKFDVINEDDLKIVSCVENSDKPEYSWETWKTIGWDVLNQAGVSSEKTRESIVYAFKSRIPLSIQYSWSIDFWIELCEYAELPQVLALRFYQETKKSFESKE
jgi:hypothetical protein